jgi:hypothetical protein
MTIGTMSAGGGSARMRRQMSSPSPSGSIRSSSTAAKRAQPSPRSAAMPASPLGAWTTTKPLVPR